MRCSKRYGRIVKAVIVSCLMGLTGVTGVAAQEGANAEEVTSPEDAAKLAPVLARLKAAYGGARLTNMRTVSIKSDRRLAWPGQGQTATLVEFANDLNHKYFDLQNQQGSVERWIAQSGNIYHNRYVVDANGGAVIDYFQASITRNPEGSFMGAFNADYRMSDALLAHLLSTTPPPLTYVGARRYGEHVHDVISFAVTPESPKVELYISQDDGLIRRLFFERSIGDINILFGNHAVKKGVSYATEIQVFIDETLVEYEMGLRLLPNARVAKHIDVEADLSAPPEPMETSEMTVDVLGDGAYLVGQDDYSLFVKHGAGITAVNAYAGLKGRFEALTSHIGEDLPLERVIVTHHHVDHIDGANEGLELGARLYVTGETQKVLSADFDDIPAERMTVMQDGDTVGPLEIVIAGTSHASENAFVFHPKTGALFQDDHYHGLLRDQGSRIQPSVQALYDIIKDRGLDANVLLSGHARKAETWAVFERAIQDNPRTICPRDREICKGRSLS